MERQITWTNNGIGIIEAEKRQGIAPAFLAEEVVEKIAAFHSSVPGYAVTPLAELSARAKELGLGNIFVKDESHRFGLNAFKGLGGEEIRLSGLCLYAQRHCGMPCPGNP